MPWEYNIDMTTICVDSFPVGKFRAEVFTGPICPCTHNDRYGTRYFKLFLCECEGIINYYFVELVGAGASSSVSLEVSDPVVNTIGQVFRDEEPGLSTTVGQVDDAFQYNEPGTTTTVGLTDNVFQDEESDDEELFLSIGTTL